MEKQNIEEPVFVGEVLYKERTGRYSNGEITEHIVTKIGRKYLECTGLNEKINISNLMYESKNYSQCNYRLYRDKQEILDENELSRLITKIRYYFSLYGNKNYKLEHLRKIAEIINLEADKVE